MPLKFVSYKIAFVDNKEALKNNELLIMYISEYGSKNSSGRTKGAKMRFVLQDPTRKA